MFRAILTGLFILIGTIFVLGSIGCIFWLGMAALNLFLKIMIPLLLIVVLMGIVLFLVDLI